MTFRPADDILEQINEDKIATEAGSFSGGDDANLGAQVFHSSEEDSSEVSVNNGEIDNGGATVQIEIPEPVYSPDLSELLKEDVSSNATINAVVTPTAEAEQISSITVESSNVDSSLEPIVVNSQPVESVIEVKVQTIENNQVDQPVPELQSQQQSLESTGNMENLLNGNSGVVNQQTENHVQDSVEMPLKGTENQIISGESESTEVATTSPAVILEGGDLTDAEKTEMVSGVAGSIHSNLDFLVEKQWGNMVSKYQKIHRIAFKRGLHIFIVICGIVSSILFQEKASAIKNLEIIDDGSIQAKYIGDRYAIDGESMKEKGIDVNPIILYGDSKLSDKNLMIKDSLVSYNGIILPQSAYIDFKKDMMSLEEFNNKEVTRSDLENVVSILVGDDYFNNGTKKVNNGLTSANEVKEKNNPKTVAGGLIDGFNLGCMDTVKAFDLVCDKALDSLLKYGKYYDLVAYAKDVSTIMGALKREGKVSEMDKMCDMISEFTWYTSKYSTSLSEAVSRYCPISKVDDYKKLVDFISVNASLYDLNSNVSEYADINAYKLLSAQQFVYKAVNGSVINASYVGKYLDFVQNLLDKDAGRGNYIEPIYKDLLYVFNTDELKYKIDTKSSLNEYVQTYKQVENGKQMNGYYYHYPLKNYLTTSDIILTGDCVGNSCDIDIQKKTVDLEDLLLNYVSNTDRLILKKYNSVSDNEMKVQTEISSSEILGANNGDTFKATITIHQKNGTLYIDALKIHNTLEINGKNYNWSNLNDVLDLYIDNKNGNAELRDFLLYIDKQIVMYKPVEVQTDTLCTNLSQNESWDVYACDESLGDPIEIYKGDVLYTFNLFNGVLESFIITDDSLEKTLKSLVKLEMLTKNETLGAIEYILSYEKGEDEIDDQCVKNNTMKKIELVQQFSMHFHIEPTEVIDVNCNEEDGSNDYIVKFSLGGGSLGDKFDFQANYNVDTHKLTKILYVASCGETLEIRNLEIEVSAENEPQLYEIKTTPRIFFRNVNEKAFQKYQHLCDQQTTEKK